MPQVTSTPTAMPDPAAPGSALPGSTPPPGVAPAKRRGGSRLTLIIIVVVVLALAAFILMKFVGGPSPSPFPDGWTGASWKAPASATPAQVDDAASMLQYYFVHLGAREVDTHVDGHTIHVGMPDEYNKAIISELGRRMSSTTSLRILISSDSTANDQWNQNLGVGDPCNTQSQPGVYCSGDRSIIGQFGPEIVSGASIADATAVSSGGTWSVSIQFTVPGARQIAYVKSQAKKGTTWAMVFLATVESEDTFALTPMETRVGVAMQGTTGTVSGLTELQAKDVAATLRLSRHPITLEGTGELD